ncbi:MAG: tetratricopeptide repeat protein [Chitinispirillaceae bacterium]|nr:tetratricopeptide repeat protein [Chitinispirillaceae bacterium]
MSKEIVAGRTALKRSFRDFFIRSIDDGRDTRSFLPFRKQREAPVPPPWIFLFYGEECLGKTTAIDYCLALAEEIALEFKRPIHTISLDWEEWAFIKGNLPVSPVELMDTIADLFSESKKDLATHFSSYRKLSESYKKNSSRVQEIFKSYQLNQSLSNPSKESAETEDAELFPSVLRTMLPQQDIDLHENGEKKLTEVLINGILSSAEEVPLILSIDSYDHIAPELEQWFRNEMLGKIADRRTKLITFFGGSHGILRNFRNDFSEDSLFSVNFSDIPLTRHTISLIASKQHINLIEGDLARIERATAGIPFLVHDVLFYASKGIAVNDLLEDVVNDVHAAETLSGTILNRFFTQCADNVIRERVFSLSMLSQYNAKALAEIWNIPFADVKNAIGELEKQISFIKNRHPHPHIRMLLRASLIQEAAHGSQSTLKPFFINFSSNNLRIFKELLTQLQTAVQSAEKRCHDPRYLTAIEQLVCGLMWSSPTDALIALPGYYIELIHFNAAAAQKLLAKVAEFRSLFSPINEKIFKQLIRCIHLTDTSTVFNRTAVEPIEDDLIAYFESVSESMNDFQRALLYHIKGTVELRKGNLGESMEQLDRSFSLLGNSAPEKTILYEDYVMLGYSFNLAGEHRNSIDTFSNAVLIHADGFIPWFTMGISRMGLEEYEGAINALNEAVKIDPLHTDAWFNLGLSYVKEEQHNMAVSAFLKATETAPERPEIWFELGSAYRVLAQHTDAVKAFRKVVLAQDDNVDAWVLLGHSCSALGMANEAIAAYQKAIDIKPKSLEPLKALGLEFFKLSRFEESVAVFTKATRISKKDPELWCLIAEAHLGAGQNEKAVDAGNKALAIEKNSARAWSVIGNAQMVRNNLDEAIDAFKKAVEAEPDNADIWQKLGTIYNSKKEHDLAIAAFKKAVAFNPELKEVWYTIGMAYETQKQYAEAIVAYEKGAQVDPKNADCWFHKGNMHKILEQFEDAFESYSHVITLNPTLLQGWFDCGSMALQTGNYKEAVTSFAKVVELDVANTEGWFQLGCAYQMIGDHQEAIRSFTEAASHEGQRTDIWVKLGASCQVLGIYEEAVSAYEKCVEIDPDNPDFPTKLGMCYYALSTFDKAHDAYKKAVELDPENLETLYRLALTCHAQENYTEAIEHYGIITSKNADHADAWFNLALAYHAIEDYTKAIDSYLIYVKKWPENGQAWFNLGIAYHAAQDIDNAILTYKEATKVTPEDPEVWYHLGMALHAKEQYGDAIQAYRKVLQFMPDHINAWFNLGMAYYVWQNYVDAIESYSNVVKRDPSHYTAWGNLAIANYANDDYVKGFDAARHAYEIKPDEPWIMGNLVVGSLFIGNSLQAQEYADHLLAIDPTGETAAQVLVQIQTGLQKLPETEGGEALFRKLQGSGQETVNAQPQQ